MICYCCSVALFFQHSYRAYLIAFGTEQIKNYGYAFSKCSVTFSQFTTFQKAFK